MKKSLQQRRIGIISAHRSERGLLNPIMIELQRRNDVKAEWCEIIPNQYEDNLIKFKDFLNNFSPHLILVPTDRNEAVYIAAHAFHEGYIIAHFHAGNLGSLHPDEINRRVISCFSHILFCNTEKDKKNLIKLGEEEWRCFVVGSTAFDEVIPDKSLCPNQPYDLVLLHPDPISKETTFKDLTKTISVISKPRFKSMFVVWLHPNKDVNHEVIDGFLNSGQLKDFKNNFQIRGDLPRAQFLGLLKNCLRFIGNSSTICYEAPFFGVQTIRIRKRNMKREKITPIIGGAKKIADILTTIEINSRLRRKKFCLLKKI